ncbi:MAG: hypothetical protein MZV65_20585 [Chromatiales bacterium]|nr:hypothetical protein [Chromatiales bacterium]
MVEAIEGRPERDQTPSLVLYKNPLAPDPAWWTELPSSRRQLRHRKDKRLREDVETLVIEVATDAELNAQNPMGRHERDEPQPPGYFFETEQYLLFDTLDASRFAILKALAGARPPHRRARTGLRRVGRDVRAVYADAAATGGNRADREERRWQAALSV